MAGSGYAKVSFNLCPSGKSMDEIKKVLLLVLGCAVQVGSVFGDNRGRKHTSGTCPYEQGNSENPGGQVVVGGRTTLKILLFIHHGGIKGGLFLEVRQGRCWDNPGAIGRHFCCCFF